MNSIKQKFIFCISLKISLRFEHSMCAYIIYITSQGEAIYVSM